MGSNKDPDLKDRDPYNINNHLKVQFHDVIGEPKSFHSCNCIWTGTECCYDFLWNLAYGINVALFHLCIAIFWGLEFGYMAFVHVWVFTPFTHCFRLALHVPATCYRMVCRCALDPWFESCSYLFTFCGESSDLEAGLYGEKVRHSMF